MQARRAIEAFVQALLDHPSNAAALARRADKAALARTLWREGLIVVYRLLFILHGESARDPARGFGFASASRWRDTYSPSAAWPPRVRRVLDGRAASKPSLEAQLRRLFIAFANGLEEPGLTIHALGGGIFGRSSTPLLSSLRWGDLAVAHLLDRVLWSVNGPSRMRIPYDRLDFEDLGRAYEALVELEPDIATEPLCRLRGRNRDIVTPAARGERIATGKGGSALSTKARADPDTSGNRSINEPLNPGSRAGQTTIRRIERIEVGHFYLRAGHGRKRSGSYYTPGSLVRFLVQETLAPRCEQLSPHDDPDPGALLKLKVLDPACGSGHFLVAACRFLADRLHEAALRCDELATKAEQQAAAQTHAGRREALLDRAADLRRRLGALPDQEGAWLRTLPDRAAGAKSATRATDSIARAQAHCRLLVVLHCLYGADLDPMAIELAKLALWVEARAEGFPLTFLDHRLVLGNSLTGPSWELLTRAPGSQKELAGSGWQDLQPALADRFNNALALAAQLDADTGLMVRDPGAWQRRKRRLDVRLTPFRLLAAAWAGGVMLGPERGARTRATKTKAADLAHRMSRHEASGTGSGPQQPTPAKASAMRCCDDHAYAALLRHVAATGAAPARLASPHLRAMIARGQGVSECGSDITRQRLLSLGPAVSDSPGMMHGPVPALAFELTFPEVFYPDGRLQPRRGFDAVLGNPPFVNAVAGGVSDDVRRLSRLLHARLGGTADLGYYFLDQATQLVADHGRIGFVQPRAVLNANAAATLRASLTGSLRPNLLFAPDRPDLFPGAEVFVCAVVLGPDKTCRVSRDSDIWTAAWHRGEIRDANWWTQIERIIRGAPCGESSDERGGDIRGASGDDSHGPSRGTAPLSSRFEVSASMTAGDAYHVRPFVADEPDGDDLKLVTTGLIDPGEVRWGRVPCRYLKKDYQHPRIGMSPGLTASLRRRLARARRPKVLVAGLSRVVECFLDEQGQYVGAVSTYSIYHPHDDLAELRRLCGILLSPRATALFQATLRGNAMGGGNTTMTKAFLRQFPVG